MNIKHIIFDLDGVLVHSEHLYTEAKKITLEHHGINITFAEIALYSGQTDEAFFQAMKDKFFELPEAAKLAHMSSSLFREQLYQKMTPMEGAAEFIQKIFNKGIKVANVTSASSLSQVFALELLGINKLFSVLVNAEDCEHFKPHPEPYIKAMQQLQASSESILVIEDTVSGVQSAKAAGLRVVGFGDTFKPALLIDAGAEYTVKNYQELYERLLTS